MTRTLIGAGFILVGLVISLFVIAWWRDRRQARIQDAAPLTLKWRDGDRGK